MAIEQAFQELLDVPQDPSSTVGHAAKVLRAWRDKFSEASCEAEANALIAILQDACAQIAMRLAVHGFSTPVDEVREFNFGKSYGQITDAMRHQGVLADEFTPTALNTASEVCDVLDRGIKRALITANDGLIPTIAHMNVMIAQGQLARDFARLVDCLNNAEQPAD